MTFPIQVKHLQVSAKLQASLAGLAAMAHNASVGISVQVTAAFFLDTQATIVRQASQ